LSIFLLIIDLLFSFIHLFLLPISLELLTTANYTNIYELIKKRLLIQHERITKLKKLKANLIYY
jgi:hypothetical protein